MKLRELIQPGNFSHRGEGPKYMQLRNIIRKAILSGALAHEDTLPAERDIAEFSGLSRVTVRNAIKLLVNDGALIQRRGSGSFVSAPSKDMQQSTTLLASFSTEMARRGLTGRSIWLERGHFPPRPVKFSHWDCRRIPRSPAWCVCAAPMIGRWRLNAPFYPSRYCQSQIALRIPFTRP